MNPHKVIARERAERAGRIAERFARQLREPPGDVQPVVWTPAEWPQERARPNPIAVEALRDGFWLVGSPAALDPAPQ